MKHSHTYNHSERSTANEESTTPTCHCDETKRPKQSSHSEPLGEESTESHKDISATPQYDGETNPQYDKIESTPRHSECSKESTESSAPQPPQPPNNGWDIIIGNPPYGADLSKEDKTIYKTHYKHAIQGNLDTYKLFIEMGFRALGKDSILSFITPLSVTSSKSNIKLHKLLLSKCEKIQVSNYGNAPARIFLNADQRVSIITCVKTNTPCQVLNTTSVLLRTKQTPIADIVENLSFVNSLTFVQEGAFCKIGAPIEKDIMTKIYAQKKRLRELMNGTERVYYRDTGGRYYDLYTTYSTTNSTTQKGFSTTDSVMLVAILSSTLFWWFRNAYSEGRHSYIYEFERFPIPELTPQVCEALHKLGIAYNQDLESNAEYRNGVKTYIIRKSKAIIDEIDKILCPLYGLDERETDFIINYNIEFRTD